MYMCGFKMYRQIVGIPMEMKCAFLVEDMFLFCYVITPIIFNSNALAFVTCRLIG